MKSRKEHKRPGCIRDRTRSGGKQNVMVAGTVSRMLQRPGIINCFSGGKMKDLCSVNSFEFHKNCIYYLFKYKGHDDKEAPSLTFLCGGASE